MSLLSTDQIFLFFVLQRSENWQIYTTLQFFLKRLNSPRFYVWRPKCIYKKVWSQSLKFYYPLTCLNNDNHSKSFIVIYELQYTDLWSSLLIRVEKLRPKSEQKRTYYSQSIYMDNKNGHKLWLHLEAI